jgi:CubicO group peptidase (beta-lactamase class C family)
MKKILIFSLALALTSCAYDELNEHPQSFRYSPNYSTIGVDVSRLARIDSLLQSYVDKGILPHALTFVARRGQVIHNKAFGWRNVENQVPLRKDDIFRMYSQTKAVTTVALMTLFEQGKFQLDDEVSKYIPEMSNRVLVNPQNRSDTSTRKAASPVQIRHLLSHTSGIVGVRGPRSYGGDFATLEDYVKFLVKAPLMFDPGTRWNYHPSSDVWAYLVEYFSGKSLQQYVQDVVLAPLGITDMAYYYPESYRDRFVGIYREENGTLAPVELWSGQRSPFVSDTRFANGGTGLNGTIEGYARFCQMLLNNGKFNYHRILGRRTIEIMAKDLIAHPAEPSNFRFGIGFQVYPGEGLAWESPQGFSPMPSAGSLSWGGMANTDYLIDPQEDMIVLLYTNRLPDTRVWEKFLNTVYQVLE